MIAFAGGDSSTTSLETPESSWRGDSQQFRVKADTSEALQCSEELGAAISRSAWLMVSGFSPNLISEAGR